VVATVSLALAAALLSIFWPFAKGLVPEEDIAQAYDRLVSVDTVRYTHEGRSVYGGWASLRVRELLTDEDREKYDLGPEVKRGNVVEWGTAYADFTTEGIYDIADRSYHVKKNSDIEPFHEGGPQKESTEHVYFEGTLYQRSENEPWQVWNTEAGWALFTAAGTRARVNPYGGLPIPGMDAIQADFKGYERLPDTDIDGVPVWYYRKVFTSTSMGIETTEIREIWARKSDRLPIKVYIETRRENPEASGTLTKDGETKSISEWHLERMREHVERGELPESVLDLPLVLREPQEKDIVAYSTFTFHDFNQPVSIQPPPIE
jgi:hypothetical protein